jgi:hypothetical protein
LITDRGKVVLVMVLPALIGASANARAPAAVKAKYFPERARFDP